MRIFTLLIWLGLFTSGGLQAQEIPVTKIRTLVPQQFQNNIIYFNPAFAGTENKRELGLTGHTMGIADPAIPANGLLYYHAPSGARELQTGVGVVTSLEHFSPYTRGKFGFVYARGLQLTKNLRIAGGLQVNGKFLSVNYEAWHQQFPNERRLTSNDSDVWPDLDAGIWINAHPFFLGGSVMNVMSRTFDFKGTASRQEMREALVTGGFKIRFTETINLTPSVLLQRGLDNHTSDITYQATAVLKFLVVGASYRSNCNPGGSPWLFNGGLNFGDKVYLVLAAGAPAAPYKDFYKNELETNLRIRF